MCVTAQCLEKAQVLVMSVISFGISVLHCDPLHGGTTQCIPHYGWKIPTRSKGVKGNVSKVPDGYGPCCLIEYTVGI